MRIVHTEVVPETALNENVRQISEPEKAPKREFFDKQWKNILRTNSFETYLGAVPVFVLLLYSFELVISLVMIRDEFPDSLNYFQRFGPPHMAIATNHVAGQKSAFIFQCFVNGIKKVLQFEDVMQRVLGNDDRILLFWHPTV